MGKKYIISEEVLLGILNYLKTRPFQEVCGAIPVLSNLPELKKEEAEKTEEASDG